MQEPEEKENNEYSSETKPLQDFVVTVNNLPKKQFAEVTKTGGKYDFVKFMLFISSSNKHVTIFENFFRWEGEMVSKHAFKVLFGCILFTCIGLGGLPLLQTENNAIKLWIPQESDFALSYAWLWSTYPPEFRRHTVIIHGDNVLTPEALQKMYKIYRSVHLINTTTYGRTWQDSCFRRPVLKLSSNMFKEKQSRRRKRDDEDMDFPDFDEFANEFKEEFAAPADYSINNYPQPYCEMVESLPTACFEETILELWASAGEFNQESEDKISKLTKEEILDKVNNWGFSELFLTEKDFKPLLGGITYDENNQIIGARAVKMEWMGRMNATSALAQGGSDTAGTGELLDVETAEFEEELIRVLLEAKEFEPTNIQVEVNVMSSFGKIASATINSDVTNLIVGFAIVFTYVNLMLGKFNMVEQRGFVSLMGLLSVGGSIFFAYGFCSYFGLKFGPLHNIIPFLLLGIGIDDMFVAVQCFQNLPEEVQGKSLHERMGEAMLRAGSAITITSLTDFLAFIIGGTTVLPALRSFCIYCAVGILVVYILQATWFFAWFSLDQRRIEEKRDGAIPCYVHQNYTPNQLSQKNILQSGFKGLGNFIMKPIVKIGLILCTLGLLGVSVWGNIELRQEFNPIWFLPPESYLSQWHQNNYKFYPSSGEQVTVFMGDLDLPAELDKLDAMHKELGEQKDIISSVNSWYSGFVKYMEKNFPDDGPVLDLSEDEYNTRLTQYLYSPLGSQYRFLFKFEESLECGIKAPKIQLSMMDFQHILMDGPKQQIPAMNRAKDIFNSKNFSGRVFPMAQGYASWETDEIISVELYRNILLALLCIFLTTWILLFNFVACLQVLMCVVLTLVNVAGFMHFWGLTIDTVSACYLIISIGLCVDYSAHIAHAFMMCTGQREDRVKDALHKIGPAVLNGGFSTFLAFVLLGASRSHVFQSFFKIFLLVVLFGLYNGLIILPIVLSFIGPRSYKESLDTSEKNKEKELGIGEELQPIIKPGCQVPEFSACQAGGQLAGNQADESAATDKLVHSATDKKSATLADSTLDKDSDYNQTNDKLSSL